MPDETTRQQLQFSLEDVVPKAALRRRRNLILPRYLKEESRKPYLEGADRDRAYEIIVKWADLETSGHLRRKETALDADFLREVFGDALAYRAATNSPDDYELARNYSVPEIGIADGALGCFSAKQTQTPFAVIELKSADTDLDTDKSRGRTPVQQCWDYLNNLPDCPWGIVSNFVSFRLYHRNKTQLAFEHFTLQELREKKRFAEFYCLFQREGLIPTRLRPTPRAARLLAETDNRQREVGDDLYESYRSNRLDLIHHLHKDREESIEDSIHVAQKLLDRIIFVAFCEDRGLLPESTINKTHRDLPPFVKVTNPRWRNFLDLFAAVDKGHKNLGLETGYNGGLFQHDPKVDDLQLDDVWTDFFKDVAGYDFRDEVNVDVLGHLFEKSVTELERIKLGGLFQPGENDGSGESRMPKSAKRKRLGIYYTPPEFTRYIVEKTINDLIQERLSVVAERHGLGAEGNVEGRSKEQIAAYWTDCLGELRSLKVCDPACGSGAFLIQAYDLFEDYYHRILDILIEQDGHALKKMLDGVPDIILSENLFGVDVSPEAVEITQLALWIRSARRGKTLADLSKNIVCANSLVTDPGVDPRAMNWAEMFRGVFDRDQAGFDCVIGNPPWERLKLQEREFFAYAAPDIAGAVSAAQRRKLIAQLERTKPELHERYQQAKQAAEETLAHVRAGGEFPLAAKGDINTYALFAELAGKIVSPRGRVGLLVPSGIASDMTTKELFASIIERDGLIALHDFENREAIFPDVHRSFKFCTFVFGGSETRIPQADFVFFARNMRETEEPDRHITLSAADLALMNPNTRTCPIFRSRRDAELTRGIYRRVPIFVDRNRREGGNPWGVRFVTQFHQTNDAELFRTADELHKKGFVLKGNRWVKGKKTCLPLYEAKMVQAYDHRAAGVVIEEGNWVRQGQTEPTSLVLHQNPEFLVQPRWWVLESETLKAVRGGPCTGILGFKDITSPTNERTMIAAAIPWVGATNHLPLVQTRTEPRTNMCLLANLNSFVLDYVARQKIGGVTLNFFIVEQLPIFAPDAYEGRCPWNPRQRLERWISDRVLKLTCTAEDMIPLAEACGSQSPVFKWKPAERAQLLAELDAAFFILYGVNRDDAEYILSTFRGTRRKDESDTGEFRTARLVLEEYDKLKGA